MTKVSLHLIKRIDVPKAGEGYTRGYKTVSKYQKLEWEILLRKVEREGHIREQDKQRLEVKDFKESGKKTCEKCLKALEQLPRQQWMT